MCKTCSDYNHTCLGYSDPPAHTRSQSDTATRRPAIPAPSEGVNPRDTRAVESHSPEPSPCPGMSTDLQSSEIREPKDLGKSSSSKDASSRIDTDAEQQAAEDSPDSGKLAKRAWGSTDTYHRLYVGRSSVSASNRTHVPYFRYFGPTAIVPGFKQMVWLTLQHIISTLIF